MSIAEYCERYGLGRTRAYEEIKSGRLRARKCGKRTIIAEQDAEDWLQHLPVIQTNPTKGEPSAITKANDVLAREEGREP